MMRNTNRTLIIIIDPERTQGSVLQPYICNTFCLFFPDGKFDIIKIIGHSLICQVTSRKNTG